MADPSDPDFVAACLRAALEAEGPDPDRDLPETLASVAVVAHMRGDRPALLWIERAANPRDPWSGQMGFPGGRQEEEDPCSRATAERETHEELGLVLAETAEYLGPLNEHKVYNRTGPAPFKLTPHAYWLPEVPELEPDPREVAGVVSVDFLHMLRAEYATEKRVDWNGKTFVLPAVRFRRSLLWGLSLRVWRDLHHRLEATELLELLGPPEE